MNLKQAAADVLHLIDAGKYGAEGNEVDFSQPQRLAVENTRLYTPDELDGLRGSAGRNDATAEGDTPRIVVTNGTTQVVAQSMAAEQRSQSARVGALNFASARNPGGGFLNGAKAQEEDLCRCSGLYPCLLQCATYYEMNRQQDSLLYTDHMIYSPDVPFLKTRGSGDLLAEPFFVSVITAPAPNSGPFLRRAPSELERLEQTFLRRWQNVLAVAHDQDIRRLLLGAWGCGAFGGDPVMASRTAKMAITQYGGGLNEIVFAIPGKGRQSKSNLSAFQAAFG